MGRICRLVSRQEYRKYEHIDTKLNMDCHEEKTAKERTKSLDSQAELAEQPCKGKLLSTVSEEKPRGGNSGAHSLRFNEADKLGPVNS